MQLYLHVASGDRVVQRCPAVLVSCLQFSASTYDLCNCLDLCTTNQLSEMLSPTSSHSNKLICGSHGTGRKFAQQSMQYGRMLSVFLQRRSLDNNLDVSLVSRQVHCGRALVVCSFYISAMRQQDRQHLRNASCSKG